MKNLIEKNIKNSEFIVFGSFVTKLYLPNADLDCVVKNDQYSSTSLLSKV